MRIAVIGSKGLPPQQGGIEHHCAEIYPRMVLKGHSVDLYARASYNQKSRSEAYYHRGVKVIPVPCFNQKGVDALTTSMLSSLNCLGRNYDVIHFHALGPSIFAWLPKLLTNAKVVATCHGLDWQRNKWGGFASYVIRSGEKVAVRWTDDLIVVSEDLQPYFWNTYRRNTVYIGNGPAGYDISDPTFSFGYSLGLKPNRYLVFLGRLVPEKNLHLLIQACKPLLADGWKLAIVGACSDTSEYCCTLKNMAQGSQNIVFTGYLGGEKLAEIMRGAGLFVLPSSVEGQPLALLEAMAERLPVLASDIPIHQRLLGDGRGILFRDGDQCSLAEMIQKAIYTSPMKMKEMANQAYQYIQSHHNWDQIVDRHLSLYRGKSSASTQPLEDVIIAQ